jgi:drug/metabolite transporter (DMT)-like permease
METTATAPASDLGSAAVPSRLGPFLLALFVIFVWGVSFAVTRATVREIPPITIAFLRFTLASLLFWPLVRRRFPGLRIAREDRLATFLLGFTGVTLYFAFENTGLKYTTASHAALITSTIPLTAELFDALRHRRRPAPTILAGCAVALAGICLIVGRNSGGGASLFGDLLMIGAVATWIWYTLLAVRLVGRYPSLFLTQQMMVVGAVTFLPAAAVETWLHPFAFPSLAAWGGVAFLGVFCSAIAFLLWNRVIPLLGVAATNNLLNGLPLVGVLTGVVALGEPMTPLIATGGVLILGGVILAGRAAPPEKRS